MSKFRAEAFKVAAFVSGLVGFFLFMLHWSTPSHMAATAARHAESMVWMWLTMCVMAFAVAWFISRD
jgi:hypothetical protein